MERIARTRRDVPKAGGLAVGAIALPGRFASACASNAAGGDAATTLRAVMSEEAGDLIPFTATQQGKSAVLQTLYMPLLQTDNESNIISQMLAAWEASDDGRTVTLTLKPGITWNDGTQVTSADLVMSLTQYLDPNISSHAGRIGGVVGQGEFANGSASSIAGLSAPDGLTAVVELVEPNAAWIANMAAIGHRFHHCLPISSATCRMMNCSITSSSRTTQSRTVHTSSSSLSPASSPVVDATVAGLPRSTGILQDPLD